MKAYRKRVAKGRRAAASNSASQSEGMVLGSLEPVSICVASGDPVCMVAIVFDVRTLAKRPDRLLRVYVRDHFNQPHHAGAALVFGPDGELLAHAQTECIRDDMIVATLDAELLAKQRSHPNYTLRTRRPELFGELVRKQVSS